MGDQIFEIKKVYTKELSICFKKLFWKL